ncbi:MAG TPA: hypothetical protein VIM58_04240 [Candidatus Methylacidiphilales bacterium]
MKDSRRKAKVGFWCPGDVSAALRARVEDGTYRDTSKAIVALLREGLDERKGLPPGIAARVDALASLLRREPGVVVALCVEGVLDLLSEPAVPPLIVEEYRLRQRREKASKAA